MRVLVVWLALASVALAQPVAPSEAERLFEEGKALLKAGNADEACKRFAQSMEKDPRQIGALMNLGLCNERAGKIATALALYQRAFDFATEANKPGSRNEAQAKIAELAPQVPMITFRHAGERAPGETVVVDEAVVNVDATLPLDPGRHTLVITAPGRLPHEAELDVQVGERREIVLPVLVVPKDKIVTRHPSSRRLVGKVVTLSGAGVAAAAGVLALYAKRDYNRLFEGTMPHCGRYPDIDGKATCDDYGQSRSERDGNLANGATVIGAVGAAAIVTGLLLWITAPGEVSRTTVVPTASATGAGVLVVHSF